MMRKAILAAAILWCATLSADNTRHVDLFMGSAGDHGQVTPAAQYPLGMISICPDSGLKNRHGGYDYESPRITGISVNRISGVGGDGTGGNLSILPAPLGTHVEIVKGTEMAEPGYYQADLNNGVRIRLTATPNTAFEQYIFAEGTDKVLSVDFNSAIDPRRSECSFEQVSANSFKGWVRTSSTCNFGAYKLWFCMRTDIPFRVEKKDATTAQLRFPEGTKKVQVTIALSPIDTETAGTELTVNSLKYTSEQNFNAARQNARKAWQDILDRVDVYGSTKEQKVLFYTSMYRLFLSPMAASSYNGKYRGTDGQVHDCLGWNYYSSWSMWDTYRTKFPMIAILHPEAMTDICRSLVSLFQTGKKNWATMDECVPTVRTEHSQVVLIDAWSKGIRGFDMAEAFEGIEKEYTEGLVPGSRQGLTRNSPDQRMETIYDLWAIGRIAEAIGRQDASAKYSQESRELFETVWKNEFMTITDQFELMRRNGLYQGTRWQYRWAVPVYSEQMCQWHGKDTLADELEEFFSRHLFNQGNEPDIQTPFMFNLFGRPEKTDSLVHALLTDDNMVHLYGGNAEYPEPYIGRAFRDAVDGYALEMDEDDGAMSAWYMFCQMGFYPVCVGSDSYELFTPLFTKIKMNLPGGKLTIRRLCPEGKTGKIFVDGKPLDGRTITHSQLFGAKELTFR